MINNQFLHAAIVVALALALAILAVAVLYRILSNQPNDPSLNMAILAILALLQGYVQFDKAAITLRNGNAPER